MTTHGANSQGFTLVEVLIATAIIGVGLVALSAAIPLASYSMQEGNQLTTATFLANERLEQVRSAAWAAGPPPMDTLGLSASPASAPSSGGATTFPDETPMAAPYSSYSRTVRIAQCGAGADCGGIADPALRQVTVTVTYRPMTGGGLSAAGTAKPATLTMYIAQR
jgi:prepilin-type N-terminal cleavage/methylation domain-containing protein